MFRAMWKEIMEGRHDVVDIAAVRRFKLVVAKKFKRLIFEFAT
jgi:hypothetical protein